MHAETHVGEKAVLARACPRRVGAPGRLIIWCPSNFFSLGLGWRMLLKTCAPTAGNFRRSCFARGKPERTSTTFPIISDVLTPFTL